MTSKTITGHFASSVHLHQLPSGMLCVAAECGEDTTCAHVRLDELHAALDEVTPGYSRRHDSPDYADGGMAAAAIEKEAGRVELADDPAYWHARFCEARQERDEAERERDELRQTRHRLLGKIDQLEVKLRNSGGSSEQVKRMFAGKVPAPKLPDYADGGVTAAAIEKEAEQIEQAQSLAALKSLGDDGTALRQAVKLAMVAATDEDVDTFCQRVSAGTTEEGTASYWHDLWQKTADQRDARDLAAHMWKKAARRLVTQRNGARRYGDFILAARDRATEQVIREQHRAEKAEHAAKERAATIKEQEALIELLRAEQPRALTPDAITEDMVKRAQQRARELYDDGMLYLASEWCIREVFTAALTEPPSRPDGAEELGELIGEYLDSTPGVDDTDLADFLAERRVRVVTEEEGINIALDPGTAVHRFAEAVRRVSMDVTEAESTAHMRHGHVHVSFTTEEDR